MNKINTFMEKAAEQANYSDMPQKHGAVIVKGGKVLVGGYNQNRTRMNKKNVCSVHAEVLALNNLMKQQWFEKGSLPEVKFM